MVVTPTEPYDLPLITAKEAKPIIQLCLSLNLVLYCWGPPGIGKTAVIMAMAKAEGYACVLVIAAQQDPADVGGVPWFMDLETGEKVSFWALPELFRRKGKILLFLDEFANAPEMVRNAYQSMLSERMLRGVELNPELRFVLASNNVSDRAGAGRITTAQGSRATHTYWKPDYIAWRDDYAVLPGSPEHPLVISFNNMRDKKDSSFTDFDPTKNDKTFTCARTWTNMSKILHELIGSRPPWKINFLNESERRLLNVLAVGTLGARWGHEFAGYVPMAAQIPSFTSIVADPLNTLVPSEPSAQYAVSAMIGREMTYRNTQQVLAYLERMPPEFNVIAVNAGKINDPAITTTPEIIQWDIKYQDLVA